jgi:S1-C subfamily serine protease
MEGSPVRDGGELLRLLAKRQAGDKVKVGLLRDNQESEVSVTLRKRNDLFAE